MLNSDRDTAWEETKADHVYWSVIEVSAKKIKPDRRLRHPVFFGFDRQLIEAFRTD
jgi:hypothetical protein